MRTGKVLIYAKEKSPYRFARYSDLFCAYLFFYGNYAVNNNLAGKILPAAGLYFWPRFGRAALRRFMRVFLISATLRASTSSEFLRIPSQ